VIDEPPWEDYSRGRLRSGMSYPVGRDFVERCLRDAAAVVGSLNFVGGTTDPRDAPERNPVLEVYWFSDVPRRFAPNPTRSRASFLFMRLWAVPSVQRRDVAQLLVEGLPSACRWAATAMTRAGTGWSASEHVLTLWHANQALEIEETN
jgi:hypothetical protein